MVATTFFNNLYPRKHVDNDRFYKFSPPILTPIPWLTGRRGGPGGTPKNGAPGGVPGGAIPDRSGGPVFNAPKRVFEPGEQIIAIDSWVLDPPKIPKVGKKAPSYSIFAF